MPEETLGISQWIADIADHEKAIKPDDHSINFVISSDEVDRHGERVEANAVAHAIKGFAANPVCLACHQHALADGTPPVIGSWDTNSFKTFKHHSEMRLNFATDTKLGNDYWTLYSQRHMKAVSIGFRILDAKEEVVGGTRIFVITKLELFEISCVAVGANRKARAKLFDLQNGSSVPLMESNNRSLLSKALDDFKLDAVEPINERLLAIEESLDNLKCLLVPDSQAYADRQLGADADPSLAEGNFNGAEAVLRQLQSIEKLLKGI